MALPHPRTIQVSLFSQCRGSFYQSTYTATLLCKFMFPFILHNPPASSFSRHQCPHCIPWKTLLPSTSHLLLLLLFAQRTVMHHFTLAKFITMDSHHLSLINRGATVLLHSSHGMSQASPAQGNRVPLPPPRAGGDAPSWQLHHKATLMKSPSCLVTHKLLCIKNINCIESIN